MKYPNHLIRLIQLLRKFPGVGTKSAERFAFDMLSWSHAQRMDLIDAIYKIPELLPHCPTCRCLISPHLPCTFCDTAVRDTDQLCIAATPRDIFAIEETRHYRGLYHALGQLLSPLDGMEVSPPDLSAVKNRISMLKPQEIILAFDMTLEGDATALYLTQELSPLGIPLSRLKFALPVGSAFDYIDTPTLINALHDRSPLECGGSTPLC